MSSECAEEIKLLKVFKEGHQGYSYCVDYFPKTKQVVSCAWDGTVRIFSLETGLLEHVIRDFGESADVNYLTGVNDYEFVVCSTNHLVSYKLPEGQKVDDFSELVSIMTARRSYESVYRLLKLDEPNLILCVCRNDNAFILSYTEKKVVKRITTVLAIGYNTLTIMSKTHKNCFFLAEDNRKGTTLVNYKTDTKIKNYSSLQSNIWAMESFCRESGEEYLVCAENSSPSIHIFNVNSEELVKTLKNITIEEPKKNNQSEFDYTKCHYSIFNMEGRYMLFGNNSGYMILCSLDAQKLEIEMKCWTRIHDDSIFKLVCCRKDRNSFDVVSCGDDKEVKCTSITNVSLMTWDQQMEENDLKERVEYLIDTFEEPLFQTLVISIKMNDFIFKTFPRSCK